MTLQPLNPREIQARVRDGESPEAIAAETGWPLDKVERWAEPLLAERAFIVEQARSVELRRSGDARTLAQISEAVIEHAQVNPTSVVWDSRRREDGKWLVVAQVSGAHPLTATWVYDHAGRNLHPVDAGARRLMGVVDAPAVAEAVVAEDDLQIIEESVVETARPHLVAVPSEPESDETEVFAAAPASSNQPTLAIPVEPTPRAERKPKVRSKGKRASVPSWDEILFGAPHHDTD